jgi:diacylglycerol kinase family enzyme
VDEYVAGASRMLGGKAAYFGASARALLAVQKGRLRCELSLAGKADTHVLHTYMLAICNGRWFGAGMHVAPMADPSDGVFELIALESTSKLAFALRSSRIYSAKHLDTATHLRCDKIRVTLENEDAGPFLLDVDGEPLGALPLDVELLRGAVTMRV